MSALWTSGDAATAMSARATVDFTFDGISIDTRTIQNGDLFVALQDVRDGHDFVADAIAKGATGALVSRMPDGVPEDAPLLIVDDVLDGLNQLALAARARTKSQVIAVTGSVGKTSTKEMLRVMLAAFGATHAAEASYNNHWGVPLTLARMPADSDFAVIEIGMNHPGEIAPLATLAQPDLALITMIAPAHLEAFASIEGIAREKAAIFEGLTSGGAAIIPGDLETSSILANAAPADLARFGEGDANDAQLLSVDLSDGITTAKARIGDQEVSFTLNVSGRHFATNAVACLAVAARLNLDLEKAAQALSNWQPPKGRGVVEMITLGAGSFTLLDDAFNANPSSMGVALETLAATNAARKVAVLGDMLELGPQESALHADIAGLPIMTQIDLVHTVGTLSRALHEALPEGKRGQHFETIAAAEAAAGTLAQENDAVLVKGSKGSKVSLLVDLWRKVGQQVA